jgi:hypothetical protein
LWYLPDSDFKKSFYVGVLSIQSVVIKYCFCSYTGTFTKAGKQGAGVLDYEKKEAGSVPTVCFA